jgi:PAS domain-containing protein
LSLAEPAATVAGRYRYDLRRDSWWWSPEMFYLHGLPADGAQPCTQLLLGAQHPMDRRRTAEALTAASEGAPFSLETRVVLPDDTVRTVVVVGEPQRDADGAVIGVEGMCIDLTAGRRSAPEDRVHELETEVEQLRTAMASRAAIEQAKGILMLLTGCGDQVAFDLLAHMSSHTHRKVREVAVAITESAAGHGRLPEDIKAILRDACPPGRAN